VGGGPLVCLQYGVHLRAHVRHRPERGVSGVEGEVVAGGLEHGQRLLEERGQLLGRALRFQPGAEPALLDPSAQFSDAVACGGGPLGERAGASERLAAFAGLEQGVGEVEQAHPLNPHSYRARAANTP
jgi:hypothetical protein